MSNPVADQIIRSLQDELFNFDHVVDDTTQTRQTVVTKLTKMLDKLDRVDVNDDKAVACALMVANTTLKAIGDQESSAVRRVNTKIKHNDQRRADNTAELVTEMFKKMSTGGLTDGDFPVVDLAQEAQSLLDRFSADGDVILDTELRADPHDLA